MLKNIRNIIWQRLNRKSIYSSASYWDFKATNHDDSAVSMWPNIFLNDLYVEEQRKMLFQYLGNLENLEVLDVGCGTGRLSRWLANQGALVKGIDFSQKSLDIALKESIGDNPSFQLCSVFDLNEEESYDLVFTWGVLTIASQDRDQLLDALMRIKRALKPNGRLFLMEPIHDGFLHRVLKMNLPDFLEVMGFAGFQIKAYAPMHFWPMRLALAYIRWPKWITVPFYHCGRLAMSLPGCKRLGDYHIIISQPSKISP